MLISVGKVVNSKTLIEQGFNKAYSDGKVKGFFNPYTQTILVIRKNRIAFIVSSGNRVQNAFGYVNNCSFGFKSKVPKLISDSKARQVSKCYYSANIKGVC